MMNTNTTVQESVAQKFRKAVSEVKNLGKIKQTPPQAAPELVRGPTNKLRRLPLNKQKQTTEALPVPFAPPANGKMYTVREALPQLVAIEDGQLRMHQWRQCVTKVWYPMIWVIVKFESYVNHIEREDWILIDRGRK
jgi:hypothetical protein